MSTCRDAECSCGINLQKASLGFGIADIIHGIVGITLVVSMITKQEGDAIDRADTTRYPERVTSYNKFLKDIPIEVLYWILTSFFFQVFLGILLALGATHRNSPTCTAWVWLAVLSFFTTPSTFCLIFLGRILELVTVLEFVWKMDDAEKIRHVVVKRKIDMAKQEVKRNNVGTRCTADGN